MGLSNPGAPGANLPKVEGHEMRRLADLERAYRELVASTVIQPGTIDASALATASAPQAIYDTTTGFALTTTMVVQRTTTITVPTAMTSAAVMVIGRVYAINPTTTGGADGAGADYLTAQTSIAGVSGVALPILARGSGGSNINVAPVSTILTGLTPGSTFNVTVAAMTQYAGWATNAANAVDVSGQIIWIR